MSFVYFAPCLTLPIFKIGKAESPLDRLCQLSPFYAFDWSRVHVLDCGSSLEAYQMEGMFHCIGNSHRIVQKYDGGTEFYDISVFEKIMALAKNLGEFKGYTLTQTEVPSYKVPAVDDVARDLSAVACKVRNRRLSLQITQASLARMSSSSERTIRELESGNGCNLATLLRVLKALGMGDPIDYQWEQISNKRARRS